MKQVLPQTILELQLDYAIVPMDQKIYSKFQKKLRPINLLVLDINELLDQLNQNQVSRLRTIIVVRPLCVTQAPEGYRQVLKLMSELKAPYIEIPEQIFEQVLTKCDQEQLMQTSYSATLQGLPQEQIAQLSISTGYANSSSFSFGFGNSIAAIKQHLSSQPQTNSFITTMIFVVHDFQHIYSPFYSEQMRCDASVGLQLVVPVSFYAARPGAEAYSPIQYLPPLCDDPTNPHFYINDCRPIGAYTQQLKSFPIPRLIIRAQGLLHPADLMILKQDDLTRAAQEIANLYYQNELLFGMAAYTQAKLLHEAILQNVQSARQISELIGQCKAGLLKPEQFSQDDFLSGYAALKLAPDISSIQQLAHTELAVSFKNIPKSVELITTEAVKMARSALNYIYFYGECADAELEYIKTVVLSIEKDKIQSFLQEYLKSFVRASRTLPEMILDWEEVEVILGAALYELILNRLLAGYFSAATPCPLLYQQLCERRPESHPLTTYGEYQASLPAFQTLEKSQLPCPASKETASPISKASLELFNKLTQDVIRIQLSSPAFIGKPVKTNTTYQQAQLLQQLVCISKLLRQKTLGNVEPQCGQFYVPLGAQPSQGAQPQLDQDPTDEEEMNCRTNRDRYKNLRIQEDTTKGKCSVCPLVYNNYKEHCRSQIHRGRYLEALKQEKLIAPLQALAARTATKNQIQIIFANVCNFIAAKNGVPYELIANEINYILQQMQGVHVYIDPHDQPRANSPTCKTESFRAWREGVLKERMRQVESLMNDAQLASSELLHCSQTLAFAAKEQANAISHLGLRQVVDALLSDVKKRFGDDVFAQIRPDDAPNVDPAIYMMDELPSNAKDFGEEDIFQPEDTFGTLALKSSWVKQKLDEKQEGKGQLKPQVCHDEAGKSPELEPYDRTLAFAIHQESTQNHLNLRFSRHTAMRFGNSFNAFLDNQAAFKPSGVQDNVNSNSLLLTRKLHAKDFLQHLRCELDLLEIDCLDLQTTNIQRLLKSTIMHQVKLNVQLSKEVIKQHFQERIWLPPIYQRIPQKIPTLQQKIAALAEHYEAPKVKTDVMALISDFAENPELFEMLDGEKYADAEVMDDILIGSGSEKPDILPRSNSFHSLSDLYQPGSITFFKLEEKQQPRNLVLLQPVLKEMPCKQMNDAEETMAEYSRTLRSVSNTTIIPQFMTNEADFSGEYVDFRSLNPSITDAVCGLLAYCFAPVSLIDPACNTYDSIIFGLLSQTGDVGVDSPTVSVIAQAAQTRYYQSKVSEERERFVRAQIQSRTVSRCIARGGIFDIEE